MSAPPVRLRRILGRREVLAVSFGAMVGWSWVILAGEMILRAGTAGSALAFVFGATMVLFVGLTYAELTSALSRAGGEIGFTYAGLGAGVSYVCGWSLVLAYLSVCAFEAAALPTVVSYLLPGLAWAPLYTVAGGDVYLSWALIGVAGSLTIGTLNYFGVRFASFFQSAAALALLLIGVAFFVPGTLRGDPDLLSPYFTSPRGFFRVVIMTPFLFLGFDVIPQMAEEIAVPFRAVGKLILISIGIALSWYVLVQCTVGLTVPHDLLGTLELPTADAMGMVYGSDWGARVLVFGGLLGILTSWNAFALGASRLLFAMARGGMLPALFGRLHPRYESPVAAVVVVTVLMAVAPFFGRPALVWLVDAGGLAAVVGYLLVTVSFGAIRKKYPRLERPYRTPAPRLVGALAVSTTVLFVLLYLPGSPSALVWPYEWSIVVAWVVLGVLFGLGARRPKTPAGRREQAELILGEYADALERER